MKVFLSWSGQASNEVAQALRDWLPAVLQATRPYFSPADIAKGARWSSEVAAELSESRVGILCVTRENLSAPWLMFEAGALAKSIESSKVIPLLVGVDPADLSGPLAQFQAAKFERTEIRRILAVINRELGSAALDEQVLSSVFDKWWPDLEAQIRSVALGPRAQNLSILRTDRELLEEILALARDQLLRPTPWLGPMQRLAALLKQPIEQLEFTVRTQNCLLAEEVRTIGDLTMKSEIALIKTPNLGRKSVNEIKEVLATYGLKLAPEEPPQEAS